MMCVVCRLLFVVCCSGQHSTLGATAAPGNQETTDNGQQTTDNKRRHYLQGIQNQINKTV